MAECSLALIYLGGNIFFGRLCTGRYANSEAAVAHLDMFAARFGDRLFQCTRRQRLVVYGNPTPELRAKLLATLPVGGSSDAQNAMEEIVEGGTYSSLIGGFSRL